METTAVINKSEIDTSENIPEEWTNFLENLPEYELQVLKAIVEQDNPKAAIKKLPKQISLCRIF